jgi:hypothetical protein
MLTHSVHSKTLSKHSSLNENGYLNEIVGEEDNTSFRLLSPKGPSRLYRCTLVAGVILFETLVVAY